ncbi:MAG TPA: OmpH family outer membrane protein [Pyrinomonadaceae bacterium]|nr:OmpH family outer membrane protein [Pyrinomonadaceae bacterium]
MKVIRNIAAAFALAAFAAVSASAQQPAANRPAAPATGAPAANVPDGKIAIIDTEEFANPQSGIARLINAFNTMEREFKPRRDEITTLKTRYDAIVKEVQDTQKVADEKTLAAKADQAETLKIEMEQKQQAGQRAYEKRWRELSDPINRDINAALQNYARSRGITLVIDISKMGGFVMVVNDQVDITKAFIADYNQRNPASAAAAAPAPNR